MVPLIDMANHAELPGAATATVMVETGTVVLRAIRAIKQGEEVTISYGHERGYPRSYGHGDISAVGEGGLERTSPGTLAMPSADSSKGTTSSSSPFLPDPTAPLPCFC